MTRRAWQRLRRAWWRLTRRPRLPAGLVVVLEPSEDEGAES